MIPVIEGPHISIQLRNDGLASLDYASSLAGELVFLISARAYPAEADAVAAYDTYVAGAMSALGDAWYAETYRALTWGNPRFSNYYHPITGISGRLVVVPRLPDPRELGARIAAYEVLCAALERPDAAFSALPLVDWVTMPLVRDWQLASAIAALTPNAPGNWRRQYDTAMSGHWAALRGLRRGLLTPWFAGARLSRNREMFTALHAGLPDELAYLALSVAAGSGVEISDSDAPLVTLAQEAQNRKLVRLVPASWHAGQTVIYRSRRVAIKIAEDEPLIRL
jgi:hypothetical protein